jgi:translation initiation factor 2 beta subunit (eIF-2beta)/eIF-5
MDKNTTTAINSSELLKQQQLTTKEMTDLLDKYTEALTCGPTCQKIKRTEELKQKYLTAQTNMQTAPIYLENSRQNYYVFTEGEPYYNNMLEEELNNNVELISETLSTNFNDEITNAITMNSYYNTDLNNSKNTKDLYEMYLHKNQEMQASIEEHHGDVLTNDRKTFYETEALNNLRSWYSILWYIYYIFTIILIIVLLFNKPVELIKKIRFIFIVIIVLIYPYIINYITKKTYSFFHSIWKRYPKNVYNDL